MVDRCCFFFFVLFEKRKCEFKCNTCSHVELLWAAPRRGCWADKLLCLWSCYGTLPSVGKGNNCTFRTPASLEDTPWILIRCFHFFFRKVKPFRKKWIFRVDLKLAAGLSATIRKNTKGPKYVVFCRIWVREDQDKRRKRLGRKRKCECNFKRT